MVYLIRFTQNGVGIWFQSLLWNLDCSSNFEGLIQCSNITSVYEGGVGVTAGVYAVNDTAGVVSDSAKRRVIKL